MKKGRTVIIHIFINIYVYTCLREGAGPDKINFGLCTDVYEHCKHVCLTLRDPYYCRKASQEVLCFADKHFHTRIYSYSCIYFVVISKEMNMAWKIVGQSILQMPPIWSSGIMLEFNVPFINIQLSSLRWWTFPISIFGEHDFFIKLSLVSYFLLTKPIACQFAKISLLWCDNWHL